ncbi:MAG: hypothetical protein ACJ76Y_25860 [Thermoanaerobaculia bacterium]
MVMVSGISLMPQAGWAWPACPLDPVTSAAKSHKLFLYFPTANDSTFPAYAAGVSPAKPFDVADLDPNIGSTNQLRNRVYDVVTDDYCEFNVEVQQTTTNPALLPSPPARRTTVAVGSDPNGAWGRAQEVDLGNKINVDFARVWGGTYVNCEGGSGGGGCSMTGALIGANATLDRWAEAIGGTAAHEAGHTYGLSHTDDNPPVGCDSAGPAPLPGEDSFKKHLMPAGCNLDGEDRAGFRRHISDRTFGLLATNVGLAIETMHNWDLINPNAQDATSLTIEFLSTLPAVSVDWVFNGSESPWIQPVVSGPFGTTVWQGTTFNRFRITWSKGNPAWVGSPGLLPGGATFHVGATFTGVDFNQPDPIIIQNITLFDEKANPLTLHPRLPMYDSGTLDPATNDFWLHFYYTAIDPNPLILQEAIIYQLPRVASIESMIGDGKPLSFDGLPITPWSSSKCEPSTDGRTAASCKLGNLADRPHVEVTHLIGEKGVYDCSKGVPILRTVGDSPASPDNEGPTCAGSSRDPFPSTTVYVIATFVDPKAEHWDATRKEMVVGPVTSKVFYQFAGVRDPRRLAETAPKR